MEKNLLNIELEVLAVVMLSILFAFNSKLKEEKGFNTLKSMYIFSFVASFFNVLNLLGINTAYFLYCLCIGIVGFLWLIYCLERFGFEKLNKLRFAFLLPLLLGVITQVFFKETPVMLYAFVFYALLTAIVSLFGRGRLCIRAKEERRELVLSIAPAVFLGVFLQTLVPSGLMSVSLSIAVSFMILLVNAFRKKMMSDELTNLPNRYGMKEELEEQFEQYERDKSDSFYVIACDMDDFKDINDEHGHGEGDRALKMVSNILTKVADRNDAKAFRYGGDEFVIITNKAEQNVAERICDEVQDELQSIHFRDDFELKISMGIKLFDGISSEEELLKEADNSLYDDKRQRKGEKIK